MVAKNILETIGNTPMVEISHIDTGNSRLFIKLENQNPGGSIKDRVGLTMINEAERNGRIKPGDTVVEATAGNTGLGLALASRMKGYNLVLVIPDKMSQEKINHLRALGVEIVLTRSDVNKGDPEYYQDMAQRIANERHGYYINQFENPSNPLAHEQTTGPEIWEQMEHHVDAIVVGVGSSGTLTGLTHFFKKVSPQTEFILADPKGSVLADFIHTKKLHEVNGSWLVEGIGEDYVPVIADFSLTKKAYSISDKESFDTVRMLLKEEGILAGSSTGTLLSAALRYCHEQTKPKRVVTLACDSGNKYLSKMYNDYWLLDQGLEDKKVYGDLRDLMPMHTVIEAHPQDSLKSVFRKMKLYDISQLPVVQEHQAVGIIDESDLLYALYRKNALFDAPVSEFMTKNVKTIVYTQDEKQLVKILDEGLTAVVIDLKGSFMGLITRFDFINYITKKKQQ